MKIVVNKTSKQCKNREIQRFLRIFAFSQILLKLPQLGKLKMEKHVKEVFPLLPPKHLQLRISDKSQETWESPSSSNTTHSSLARLGQLQIFGVKASQDLTNLLGIFSLKVAKPHFFEVCVFFHVRLHCGLFFSSSSCCFWRGARGTASYIAQLAVAKFPHTFNQVPDAPETQETRNGNSETLLL